jgi:hypothetical protein
MQINTIQYNTIKYNKRFRTTSIHDLNVRRAPTLSHSGHLYCIEKWMGGCVGPEVMLNTELHKFPLLLKDSKQ